MGKTVEEQRATDWSRGPGFSRACAEQHLAPLRKDGNGSIGNSATCQLWVADVQWNTDQNAVRAVAVDPVSPSNASITHGSR